LLKSNEPYPYLKLIINKLIIFFKDTSSFVNCTLSLHDALPISIQNDVAMAYHRCSEYRKETEALQAENERLRKEAEDVINRWNRDRKSTRLNSSHVKISYAVFCLKKKKIIN